MNKLTVRMAEVCLLVASGLKNKEIADQLRISVRTVEATRYQAYQRLAVTNTAQLMNALQ